MFLSFLFSLLDSAESPRYGTIRRQKACAPSPPMKLQNVVSNDPNGSSSVESQCRNNGELQHNNHQRAKELFPTTNTEATASSYINNNNNNGHTEKPEIPPLPKQLLMQNQQMHTHDNATNTTISGPILQGPPPPLSAKPVPMTRTQFFGLDTLPSPVADRKSNDSVNSLTFKPDLPQKPKIPKRPMVLGLTSTTGAGGGGGGGNKSDDECASFQTPTNAVPTTAASELIATSTNITSSSYGNGTLRGNKTAEQLVQEHCDNVTALQANIGSSNTSIPSALLKEANHNNHTTTLTTEINANANPTVHVPPPPSAVNKLTPVCIPPPPSAVNKQLTTTFTYNPSSLNSNSLPAGSSEKPLNAAETRLTPTTPISPNMIMTPKRPTVPAPPPPTALKKPVE